MNCVRTHALRTDTDTVMWMNLAQPMAEELVPYISYRIQLMHSLGELAETRKRYFPVSSCDGETDDGFSRLGLTYFAGLVYTFYCIVGVALMSHLIHTCTPQRLKRLMKSTFSERYKARSLLLLEKNKSILPSLEGAIDGDGVTGLVDEEKSQSEGDDTTGNVVDGCVATAADEAAIELGDDSGGDLPLVPQRTPTVVYWRKYLNKLPQVCAGT